jgi:tetratricopeptide (TPR) repeat protein
MRKKQQTVVVADSRESGGNVFERIAQKKNNRKRALAVCGMVGVFLMVAVGGVLLILNNRVEQQLPGTGEETVAEAAQRISADTNGVIDEGNVEPLIAELEELLAKTEDVGEKAEMCRLQGKTYSNAKQYDKAAVAYKRGLGLGFSEYDYLFLRSLAETYELLGDGEQQREYLELLLDEPYEGNASRELEREYYVNKLRELELYYD